MNQHFPMGLCRPGESAAAGFLLSGLAAGSLRLTGEWAPLKEIYECPVVSALQLLGFVMGYRDGSSSGRR